MSNYKPRTRNVSGHDGKTSTARWFDDRNDVQANPCGFEPERWTRYQLNQRGK